MTGLIAQLLAWPTLGVAVLVFGFAPGVALRLIVLFYPRGNPRRQELLGELYAVPTIERPFWVAAQLEVALFEGLGTRFRARRDERLAQRAAERAGSERVPAPYKGFWIDTKFGICFDGDEFYSTADMWRKAN